MSVRTAKFGRKRDQREALLKGLADSLILHGSIETTLIKAKAVSRYTEKLVGQAKKDSLESRRRVIKNLNTKVAAHKLVDEIAPQLSGRNSGYFRVKRTQLRRGDGVQLATVSFVDELKTGDQAPAKKATPTLKPKTQKTDETKVTDRAVTDSQSQQPRVRNVVQAPKRSGRRGNR